MNSGGFGEILSIIRAFVAGVFAVYFKVSCFLSQDITALSPGGKDYTARTLMTMTEINKALVVVFPAVDESLAAGQLILPDDFRIVVVRFHETHQLLPADAAMSPRGGRGCQAALNDPVSDRNPSDIKHERYIMCGKVVSHTSSRCLPGILNFA